MSTCPSCAKPLDDGLFYLDGREKPVRDQARAAWKTCPHCSDLAGVHVFLPSPDAFGATEKRVTSDNPMGLHSWCVFHRNPKHVALENDTAEQRVCGGASTSAKHRKGAESDPPEVPLSVEQHDALVGAQVGWIELSEEGRKVLRTHLATERKPGNRRVIIQLRAAKGALACDACDVDLAELYAPGFAQVLELHHRRPLAAGVQKPKSLDDFALLCPTCHRIVHYRREEPLGIAEVRQLLAQAG